MRRLLLCVAAVAAVCSPLRAQGLQGQIGQLFIFGPGEDPLFLSGTADPNNPASIQVHGTHFIPAAVSSNGTVISFVTGAISTNVADFPFSSASGGTTRRQLVSPVMSASTEEGISRNSASALAACMSVGTCLCQRSASRSPAHQ